MAARKLGNAGTVSRVEHIMSSPAGYGLKLTHVQRAICRAIDGAPLDALWKHKEVRDSFRAQPVTEWKAKRVPRPFEVVVCAGIRGGKTMLACATAIDRAVNADLSLWKPGESPPILPLLSVRKHNARAAFSHLRGLLTKKGSMFGDHLANETADTLTVRHAKQPDCTIDIMVLAGSRAASNLESYWLAAAVFDEAFKMSGRDESAMNLEDAQVAARERILTDGQILYIGSPWAPEGPAWQMVRDHWGKPSSRMVVVRAPGPVLNPVWWTPERLQRLERSTDKRDREIYITSGLAEFLDPETSLISSDAVLAVTREAPERIPYQPGVEYVAAMDPATRHNAWTLMIGSRKTDAKLTIDLAREWLPTAANPLDPEVVLGEIAMLCHAYHCTRVWTDRWSVEAMRAVAAKHRLSLLEHQGNDTWELYDTIRLAVSTGALDLPPLEQVRLDLIRILKRPTSTGMKIILPTTADGRHCDYAPPLALLLSHAPAQVTRPAAPVETDESRLLSALERRVGDELEGIGGRL
jgi:hypothetical protein